MIKAVLFDLDGTVLNTNELILESWKYALEKHTGKCPGRDELIKYFGEPLLTTAERFDKANAEKICDTYRNFNHLMHDRMVQGYDGMENAIRQLKELGLKTGIVTSKRRETTERGLKLFGLFELMDIIVTVEDTIKHKPNGEPLLKAIDALGISCGEALYVGDTHYDILCGRNAETRTCLVKYTMLPLKELLNHNPDYVIDKPLDLVDIIKSNMCEAV